MLDDAGLFGSIAGGASDSELPSFSGDERAADEGFEEVGEGAELPEDEEGRRAAQMYMGADGNEGASTECGDDSATACYFGNRELVALGRPRFRRRH